MLHSDDIDANINKKTLHFKSIELLLSCIEC